ncbi:MAG: hypothetical protein ACRDF4_10180, partial [Rhabdochlamydiaceae bacterium]
AEQPKFWAGLPEFYALAKLYKIRVIVRRVENGIEVDESKCDQYNRENGRIVVKIWYDGRHFQNKIEKVEFPST